MNIAPMRQLVRTPLLALLLASAVQAQDAPVETERLILTGTGPDDAVDWQFTVDGGMRAGEQATIPVPSNWQQQGFGSYQYGYVRGPRAEDSAVYRRTVDVPADWDGRAVRIVFDGVMTDARVVVNGTQAGPVHQGGFNRFSYDVTRLIRPGESNSIEVRVDEASAAPATDVAERWGDYWVFGGIYRPAWLEAQPAESIGHVAIAAEASGALSADIELAAPRTVTHLTAQVVDAAGQPMGPAMATELPAGGTGEARIAGWIERPLLWSAETPHLYGLEVTLWRGEEPVHRVRRRFGFRTFEIREGDGLYLNGQRIMLRGVNRHSFRADTGRALSRADSYADARMLRDLNMNAVRMSHYAPEEAFLEAADELGLYVMDELSGWQKAHDTQVGRQLVRELVRRDVNHPSILLWANGNEGGWNRELDADFALHDPQDRPVVHPWELFNGLQTDHYPRYHELEAHLAEPHLVLPTEFLHGLYDGGHGAGLDDYWTAMLASPVGTGGFLWNLADEGIARTDQNGRIEVAATMGADGLVGPRHEPEPSYYTIKQVWSPVQAAAPALGDTFDGALTLTNRHDFTALDAVTFDWRWLRFAGPQADDPAPEVLAQGSLAGPPVAPHAQGVLRLPLAAERSGADALELVARNTEGETTRWVWPTPQAAAVAAWPALQAEQPRVEQAGGELHLVNGRVTARFDAANGELTGFGTSGAPMLAGGPRLVFARPAEGEPQWQATTAAAGDLFRPAQPGMANMAEVDLELEEEDGWAGFTLQVSPDGATWRTVYEGARIARDGNLYPFPAQPVTAVRVLNPYGSRKMPQVRSVRLAWQAERFPDPAAARVQVQTGTGTDATTGQPTAWLEALGAGGLERVRWTLAADGTLAVDYAYSLEGPMLFHGITFGEVPGAQAVTATALLRGPWPVWQNRLRGPQLGVHVIAAPGSQGLPQAHLAGYYADPRWVRLDRTGGETLVIRNEGATPYLQLGARMADLPSTSAPFPAGALGFMHAIPAMGAKFQPAEQTGPAGQPAIAQGRYAGRLLINLPPMPASPE
ncbi:glycoside hydrolase family 2 TIM barrel-domain containing protein [Croceibacterium ferulae]|uniref:glycoside hydrolase family 2 TIM barrel-domain containing protein n=1 Tax=Croceibacterium ferulae TaxID=1854641 RepID=UPI0013902CDB|nr:glycoside hydrolase family 2 TIM barrel-domain containing protein [Croceibacterium ferulae]